jgi:hypothetical protein
MLRLTRQQIFASCRRKSGRHQPQVRFNGSQQGGPPVVGDRDLNTAPVVVVRAARDQARLLHPDQQPVCQDETFTSTPFNTSAEM